MIFYSISLKIIQEKCHYLSRFLPLELRWKENAFYFPLQQTPPEVALVASLLA